MAAILLTGAAGAGKTQAAILQIKRMLERKLFGKIWVLLPTDLQITAFRARLLKEIGEAAHFGVEFFDFYDLYARLLELAGTPQRRTKDTARFRILRHVLETVQAERPLKHFDAIAHTSGFVTLIASLIEELKQMQITPEDFTAYAVAPKDEDVARIYSEYQNFLRTRDLVDSEGEGWLARARLETPYTEFSLSIDLLVVDGYDQFNDIQAQLLAFLTGYIPDVLLTLTYEQQREATAHRRFAQTRKSLFDYHDWVEQVMPPTNGSRRDAALDHLSDHLFDIRSLQTDGTGSIRLIEAPNRLQETQHILRDVKRLLLAGTPPDEIAIIARDLTPYAPYFHENAAAYGIPLAVRRGVPLNENPAVAAFLALIDLHTDQFRRHSVIDALQSVYLRCPDLTAEQIAKLDRISRKQIVVRGRDHWLEAIDGATRNKADEDNEPTSEQLTLEEAAALRDGLTHCFDRITPPSRATARQYIHWLEGLIGPDPEPLEDSEDEPVDAATHFGLIERLRDSHESALVTRDLAALDCLKRILLEVLSAYDLVKSDEQVMWETFRLDLQTAIDNTAIHLSRIGSRLGRVLLASVYEARGLPHDHVFIVGLSEGEFPAKAAENVLYTDEERRTMQHYSIPLLTSTESTDEGSLFYEITALARQTLTITHPFIDERGTLWPASTYWRAVQQLVAVTPEKLPITAATSIEASGRLSEAMTALAQALNGSMGKEDHITASTHNWLIGLPQVGVAWVNALRSRQIELRRRSRFAAHDHYTGHLTDSTLRQRIAELLGPQKVWSASQFNEYGTCPFQFYAKRLLQLEPLTEPEAGMDQLQHGILYHEILEKTYRRIDYENIRIVPYNTDRAISIFESVADELLADAPQRIGFRATPLWEHEQAQIRKALHSLIVRDFSEESPINETFNVGEVQRQTIRQEVKFGSNGQPPLQLNIDGTVIKVRGAIDRVDEMDGRVVVIDYKTGSSTFKPEDMIEGRNVQMLIYMAAADQLLASEHKQVDGGAFWHIGTQKLSGITQPEQHGELLEAASETLRDRVMRGRQGVFVNTPSKQTQDGHCAAYCDFKQLCRYERGTGSKPVNVE
jgi:ATP-dependent helicase/nuclease subunit B